MNGRFAILTLGALGACSGGDAPTAPTGTLRIEAGALSLVAFDNVCYDVVVRAGPGADDPTVWSQSDICSDVFGNGLGGDVAYVGACDASVGFNRVEVNLASIWKDGQALSDWVQPPLFVDAAVPCEANRDTQVEVNFTVMRKAEQGFVDVSVDFDDVFCSAKLDCQDELLLYPASDPLGRKGRGPAAVIGYSCSSGKKADGTPSDTYLYLDQVKVLCEELPSALYVRPNGGPGNMGPVAPAFFQTAVYPTRQSTDEVNACSWNLALGVELAELARGDCLVELTGTASSEPFDEFRTPEGTIWPLVTWKVMLSLDEDGQLACGANGLDAPTSNVRTRYTKTNERARLGFQMSCQEGTPIEAGQHWERLVEDLALNCDATPEGVLRVHPGPV